MSLISSLRILATATSVLAPFVAEGVAQAHPFTDREHVTVEIVVVSPGKKVPRLPIEKGDVKRDQPMPFAVVGRKVSYRVGSKKIADRAALLAELSRINADKSTWRKVEESSTEASPLPILVAPGDKVLWNDVVSALGVAIEAGFYEIQCAGTGAHSVHLQGMGVWHPIRELGVIVAPRDVWCVPDHYKKPSWRPILIVRQDGRTCYRGKTLFDSNKKSKSVATLKGTLKQLSVKAKKLQGIRDDESEWKGSLNNPILLFADKWAKWSDVCRVIKLGKQTKPRFTRFHFAASDSEYEKRLRAGKRF